MSCESRLVRHSPVAAEINFRFFRKGPVKGQGITVHPDRFTQG